MIVRVSCESPQLPQAQSDQTTCSPTRSTNGGGLEHEVVRAPLRGPFLHRKGQLLHPDEFEHLPHIPRRDARKCLSLIDKVVPCTSDSACPPRMAKH